MKQTLSYFVGIICLLFLSNSVSVCCQEKTDSIQEKPKEPLDTSSWQYNTYGTYYLGNVGVGTPYPIETLDINGSVRGNQSGALRINSGNGYLDIGAKNDSWAHFNTDRPRYYFDKEIRVNSGLIGSYDENLSLRTSGSTKMTITTAGNVGVGITSPTEKFQVAGKIHSTSGGFKFPDGTVQTTAATGSSSTGEVWGIVDNNNADDANAITLALKSYKHVSLLPNKVYELLGDDRIVIGENSATAAPQTLYVPASTTILFYRKSGGSFAAIEMREKGCLIGDGKIKMQDAKWSWGSSSKAAIMITGQQIKIDFGTVEGFEYGLSMGGLFGIQGCNIRFRNQLNCVIGVYMDPSSNGWVNQNYIHIDNMQSWSNRTGGQPDVWEHSCGIYMNGHCPNTNTLSGHIEGTTVGLILVGKFNRIEGLRLEGCKTKIRIEGSDTYNNSLYGAYGEIAGLQTPYGGELPIENLTGHNLWEVLSIFGWDDWTDLYKTRALGISVISDKRIKNNITDVKGATNKILALRGTTFNYKTSSNEENKKKEISYGFIAQELKEVLPELVETSPFDSLYSINYNGVIPVLVEAFKEQYKFSEKQKDEIHELKEEISLLVDILKEKNIIDDYMKKSEDDLPSLSQNTPNPFNEQTEISYYIPGSTQNAYILVFDMNGRQLKRFDTLSKGHNKVIINKKELTPGMYIYSLIVDEKEIGTKRMILTE